METLSRIVTLWSTWLSLTSKLEPAVLAREILYSHVVHGLEDNCVLSWSCLYLHYSTRLLVSQHGAKGESPRHENSWRSSPTQLASCFHCQSKDLKPKLTMSTPNASTSAIPAREPPKRSRNGCGTCKGPLLCTSAPLHTCLLTDSPAARSQEALR
jgi:hypothetical protein